MTTFRTVDERRRLLDISQKSLCRKASIAVSTYTRIKKGKTSPTQRTVDALNQALDIMSGVAA
jgi:transcriptional regulator with XRE-family HTH domain